MPLLLYLLRKLMKESFRVHFWPSQPVCYWHWPGPNCFAIVKDTIHCFGILFFFCRSCLHCFWWFICWFHIADQARVYLGVTIVSTLKHLYSFAWELWLQLVIKINNSVVYINQRLRQIMLWREGVIVLIFY